MHASNIGTRTLAHHRADAELCMRYKIVNGIVGISSNQYFFHGDNINIAYHIPYSRCNYHVYSFSQVLFDSGIPSLNTLLVLTVWMHLRAIFRHFIILDIMCQTYCQQNCSLYTFIIFVFAYRPASILSTLRLCRIWEKEKEEHNRYDGCLERFRRWRTSVAIVTSRHIVTSRVVSRNVTSPGTLQDAAASPRVPQGYRACTGEVLAAMSRRPKLQEARALNSPPTTKHERHGHIRLAGDKH